MRSSIVVQSWLSRWCCAVALAVALAPRPARATNDGLADRPPMGWNCYHWFGTAPTEAMIRRAADEIVASGLRAAGYRYVNIDDGWMAPRDAAGRLVAKPQSFPSGMKAVTDYLHARGLQAGIYLTCGLKTYQDEPGSLGHEESDAAQIAAWGFDFLKYDYRTLPEDPPQRDAKAEMIAMSRALRKTGRPIVYSMCEHGRSQPWTWAADYAHLWRISTDIKDQRAGEFQGGWGFQKIVDDKDAPLAAAAGPGHWNDPDMLIVGLHGRQKWMGPGCTDTEYRAHFSLWCLLAAPLMLGVDPGDMSAATKAIVLNHELIAVDQDALGRQATRVSAPGRLLELWVKPLQGSAIAVGLYNRGDKPAAITAAWSDIGLPDATRARVRDLWTKKSLGTHTGRITRTVDPQDCVVLKIAPR